jgi:hypothetical protein
MKTYVALWAENADTAVRRALKVFRTLYGIRPPKDIKKIERAYRMPSDIYSDYRPIKVPRSHRWRRSRRS